MKFPSEKHHPVSEDPNRWSGPCDDSFCYASCDMPTCRYALRLGKTPKEHNAKLEQMKISDLEAARRFLAENGEVVAGAPTLPPSKPVTAEDVVASLRQHPDLAKEVVTRLLNLED